MHAGICSSTTTMKTSHCAEHAGSCSAQMGKQTMNKLVLTCSGLYPGKSNVHAGVCSPTTSMILDCISGHLVGRQWLSFIWGWGEVHCMAHHY